MAQTKKPEVRETILACAYKLFREKSYAKCSMADIARASDISVSTIYVYFPSKTHLCYEVYSPLIVSRTMKLVNEAKTIKDPKERLTYIFLDLWRDMPKEKDEVCFNLMQAIVNSPQDVSKTYDKLSWCVDMLHNAILECIPKKKRELFDDTTISFLAWMTYDGFVMNAGQKIQPDFEKIVEKFVYLLYGK